MRKYSEKIFNSIMDGDIMFKVGNHSMNKIGDTYYLMFHGNIIMAIDTLERRIIVDDCDFKNASTTSAINYHLEAIKQYTFHNEFKFYDASSNKRFIKTIKALFNKEVEK